MPVWLKTDKLKFAPKHKLVKTYEKETCLAIDLTAIRRPVSVDPGAVFRPVGGG